MLFQTQELLDNITYKRSLHDKGRQWFIEHPKLNPYRFSFKKIFQIATSRIRTLPDFLIIGSSKSGTTSLYSYLRQHPNVFAETNIHFFEYILSNNILWYKSHFPTNIYKLYIKWKTRHDLLSGEHVVSHLFHPLVPQRVKEIIPTVKLIVLLRNPVERAYSHYQMLVRNHLERRFFIDALRSELKRIEIGQKEPKLKINNPDFDNAVSFSYLRHGIYVDKLKHWMNFFPKEQFLIFSTDELNSNPKYVIQQTFDFLNLPPFEIKNLEKQNVGKYEKIDEETKEFLIKFYKPHNERLYQLLDRDLHWNNSNK